MIDSNDNQKNAILGTVTLWTGVYYIDSNFFSASFGGLFEAETQLDLLWRREAKVETLSRLIRTLSAETSGEVTEDITEQLFRIYIRLEALIAVKTWMTTSSGSAHIIGSGSELIVLSSLQ